MSAITLTPAQADEVRGLLDVAEDEVALGNLAAAWGTLDGRELTVADPEHAATDLRWRADWHEQEADVHDQARVGAAMARSLRSLALRIETAHAEARA